MPLGAQFVLMLLFGAAGVHHARHLEKKYGGRQAWGLPSWAWGLITAFSLLLGAILLAVAERGLKQPVQTYAVQQSYGVQPQQVWGYGQPAYGQPADGQPSGHIPVQVAAAPVAAAAAPAQVPAPAVPAQVPAGWHPDPSGKHQHRWWDGAAWTPHVSTNGVASVE